MKGKKYGIIVSVITMIISLVLILLFNWCDKEKYLSEFGFNEFE